MINHWLITGDTHGEFTRFGRIKPLIPKDEVWAVIILGDAGFNYYLSKTEKKRQKQVCRSYPNLRFYCVRGNHEQRPELVDNVVSVYDKEVQGEVWWDPDIPNIKYFKDGATYQIEGNKTLVVGGAYSVDKNYRLWRGSQGQYAGWFEGEQLTQKERDEIVANVKGQHFDLVLAHTCPFEWMPRDLFLSCVNQSEVDNSMELWLTELLYAIDWNVFLCGHFHDTRDLAPHAEMLNLTIKDLQEIMDYWKDDHNEEFSFGSDS